MELDYDSSKNDVKQDGQSGLFSRVTIEHAVYLLILILALVLRIVDIGYTPLSPEEASEALSIWKLWQPGSIPASIQSPIYFSLTAFLTQGLGFSDAVMRLVPVLFGTALVLLPWFLRHRIGKIGAILASLLFALSPTLTIVSRTAGGQSIAVFTGLFVFIAWLHFQESGGKVWFYSLAGAVGIGLLSAPLFYGIMLALGLAWIAQLIVGPALVRNLDNQPQPTRWPNGRTMRDSALIFVCVLIIGGTAILLFPGGIGSTADIFATWMTKFFNFADSRAWLSPFLAIGRYEIVLLLLGLLAFIWATRREDAFPIYLVYWICGSLLLMLVQPGEMSNMLALTLPGYLLVGYFVGPILAKITSWSDVAISALVVLSGAIVFVNLMRYGRLSSFQSASVGTYHILLSLAALVFTAIIITTLWSLSDRSVVPGLVGGLLIVLLIFTWSNAWWLSREGSNDTRESWSTIAADDDLRLMARSIGEISWQLTNSEQDLTIKSTIDNPTLSWYLRNMTNLEMVSTISTTDFSQAIISPMEDIPPSNNDYIGSDFAYLRTDTPHYLDFGQSLNWWLFRESPVPINEERLILWLRADLVGGAS